jgi:hypothetical protein
MGEAYGPGAEAVDAGGVGGYSVSGRPEMPRPARATSSARMSLGRADVGARDLDEPPAHVAVFDEAKDAWRAMRRFVEERF